MRVCSRLVRPGQNFNASDGIEWRSGGGLVEEVGNTPWLLGILALGDEGFDARTRAGNRDHFLGSLGLTHGDDSLALLRGNSVSARILWKGKLR